jgi:DNA helicase II / ATP-dependent DNA helicase PcrA
VQLNPQQKIAVKSHNGRVLILAGAGSGKTSVLAHRIADMIKSGIDPGAIVGLTFTNKAAAEMRQRVARITGKQIASKVVLSTFHSFCMQLLRREIDKLGYTQKFTLYDEKDIKRLFKQLTRDLLEHEGDLPSIEVSYQAIQDAKNRGISPEEFTPDGFTKELYTNLQTTLRAYNAVDFDSLITLTVELFTKHPEVLKKYQNVFRYFMIDEYQDTNPIQYKLAQLLSSHTNNLCVVGDDDQSIYGWRGAEIAHILDFPHDVLIKLEQNYRSTPTILKAANAVIQNNKERHNKSLWSNKADGSRIEVFNKESEEEEAEAVLHRILEIREKEERPWSDFAILYRSNLLARPFERLLLQMAWKRDDKWVRGIPYQIFGGTELFERAEVKDLMSYLKVIANPKDQTALLRIINYPRRGISDNTLDILTQYNRKNSIPLWNVLQNLPDLPLTERARGSIPAFVALIKQAHDRFTKEPLADALTWLIETIDYKSTIQKDVKSEKMQEFKWESVKECIHALKSYETDTANASLQDFIGTTLLDKKAPFAQKDRFGENKLTLLTFHSSKGLEYPVCFLVGLEDHIIPHERSMEDTGLEEERRLMYVAITRCQERLHMSMARKRKRFGKETNSNPSRFLFEIPKDLIQVN